VAAVGSGIGAGGVAFFRSEYLSRGDNFVCSTDIYGGTVESVRQHDEDDGHRCRFVDPADPENSAAPRMRAPAAIMAKPCPTPKLDVFPIAGWRQSGARSVFPDHDNTAAPVSASHRTWCGHHMHSTTKYIGGMGLHRRHHVEAHR